MKLGIISDTHDHMQFIKDATEFFKSENVDLVIHGGDHVAPFSFKLWKAMGIEIMAVYGNNDGEIKGLKKMFSKIGRIFERPHEFILEGKNILLMHEPDNLREFAASDKYDVIIYGHTHKKVVKKEGDTLIINPGEGCGWITGAATCMTLDLDTFEVKEHILGQSPLDPLGG